MKKVIIVSLITLIIILMGYNNVKNSKNYYNIEKFENEMKDKGYNVEIQDVSLHFLPTTAKRMIIDDIVLDIYIFNSNKKMEYEASNIDSDGWGYSNGSKSVNVEWVSSPHFYKKGKLIVQYIGENKNIIADLENILNEQFAGQTQ